MRGIKTQEAFGQELGIGNQAAVGFFLNGKTALSPKAAAGFARGLRCTVAEFSPRLAAVIDQGSEEDGAWPFPGIAIERIRMLGRDQRIEMQGVLRERLERFEAEREKTVAAVRLPGKPLSSPTPSMLEDAATPGVEPADGPGVGVPNRRLPAATGKLSGAGLPKQRRART